MAEIDMVESQEN